MSFPIQFMRPRERFDLLAYAVNAPLNGALVVIGGAGVLSVSSYALNVLGFEGTSEIVAKSVPVVFKTAGVVGAVTLGVLALFLAKGVREAINGAR